MSMKAMKAVADIDVTATARELGVTYFPYFEPREKVAYAAGVHGWNASLYKGSESGALYYVTDMSNDFGTMTRAAEKMGAREMAVTAHLDHVEVLESRNDKDRAAMYAVASDGSRFEVTCTDDGHRWEICG